VVHYVNIYIYIYIEQYVVERKAIVGVCVVWGGTENGVDDNRRRGLAL